MKRSIAASGCGCGVDICSLRNKELGNFYVLVIHIHFRTMKRSVAEFVYGIDIRSVSNKEFDKFNGGELCC